MAMQASVGYEERMASRLLSVDYLADIDASLADQVWSQIGRR